MMNDLPMEPNADIPFVARFADAEVLVVDKPAGIVTQPGKGHSRDSLLNGLFSKYGNALRNMGESRDWGLLHRLDRDTSGLVMVALRPRAYETLRDDFAQRRIKKRYLAIVRGCPRTLQGTVQQSLLEVHALLKTAKVSNRGQPALTAYRVLATSHGSPGSEQGTVSLIEARPATGRLHQVRVHAAWLGCPILGDVIYGEGVPMPRVPRLCLHAAEVEFVHPTRGVRIHVESPLPMDMSRQLSRLGLSPPDRAVGSAKSAAGGAT